MFFFRVISQLLDIILLLQQKHSSPVTTATLTEQLGGLIGGPKISWADESNTCDDSDQTINVLMDFNSCTPFKTPSRKPNVLRQLVLDSRGLSGTTKSNTIVNIGPIRSKLLFTGQCMQPDTVCSNVNETYNMPATATDDEVDVFEKQKTNIDTDKAQCVTGLNKTYSMSVSSPEIRKHITDNKSEYEKSHIPIKTPLKSYNKGSPVLPVKRSRVRSYTEGNSTFSIGNPTRSNNSTFSVNKQTINGRSVLLDKTFQVTNIPSYAKNTAVSQLRGKKLKLGAPTRKLLSSNLHKENVHPRRVTCNPSSGRIHRPLYRK